MIGEILSERVRDYAPADALEQEHVLAELLQRYVLAALSRSRLFSRAGFHGDTCLHICYGMNRFSEDLDFLLKEPDPDFQWEPYLDRIIADCRDEGLRFEAQGKFKAETAVKKCFLKTGLGEEIPGLMLPFLRHPGKKIRIKLGADSNPPAGSHFESRYIDFPMVSAITTQTLPSGFGTKSHVSKKVVPDLTLLGHALEQQSPWAGHEVNLTRGWYLEKLKRRIQEINWDQARTDVRRFITVREQESLELWGTDLFLQYLDRLAAYMGQ
jgi:hypothetical protein